MDQRARAFQEFERQGWDEVAEEYAKLMDAAAVTNQAADALLDGAGVGAGTAVVDVACGPGVLAAEAATRGASVIGVDISKAMVEVASRRHPDIEFRVGPAEALPLPDGSCDAVVSAWGLPHFGDHGAFFAEAHRVLRPGGRLSVGTWAPPPENVFFATLLGAVAAEGRLDVGLPPGPDMFRYADPDVCRRELEAAGLTEVAVRSHPVAIRFDEGLPEVVRFLRGGSVRSRALFRAQTPDAQDRILAAIGRALEKARTAGGVYELASPAILISARRP